MHQHTHRAKVSLMQLPNLISLCCTGTTHICKSAQASGSPRTNSTFMTPNCCSSALLLNNRSASTQEGEDERATSTSSPTSSTLCFMSWTRMYISDIRCIWQEKLLIRHLNCTKWRAVEMTHKPKVSLFDQHSAGVAHVLQTVTAVQELRPVRKRTCRVSRSSRVRNGWRAHTRLKDRTISPSWPCTSCRLNAGGLHGYTSYEDSWLTHMPARSQQSAPTSTTLKLPKKTFCPSLF